MFTVFPGLNAQPNAMAVRAQGSHSRPKQRRQLRDEVSSKVEKRVGWYTHPDWHTPLPNPSIYINGNVFLPNHPDPNDENVDRLNAAELAQLEQAEAVTWPGPRRDILAVLAISDIFALPSAYREGIPRVLLEAASMALPIVTTDSPGCNDVVQDGVNGFLVPVRDSAALAKAIWRLIEQPELWQRFGQISRQRAVEQFDLSVVADQTRSVYRQLLARKAPLPAMES